MRGGQEAARRLLPPAPLPAAPPARPASAEAGGDPLVCLSRTHLPGDPHPGAGGGKGSEHGDPRRTPRHLRPAGGSALRRGSHLPPPFPLPRTPFSKQRGPGRGPAACLGGAPGRGGGLAEAAAWLGRRDHVSSSQSLPGPRWATQGGCSPLTPQQSRLGRVDGCPLPPVGGGLSLPALRGISCHLSWPF